MGELYEWLRGQHSGLRTYKVFREKVEQAAVADPTHRALYRLLSNIAAGYVAALSMRNLSRSMSVNGRTNVCCSSSGKRRVRSELRSTSSSRC